MTKPLPPKRIYGPYEAIVMEIHDGDTVSLDIDLGFGHFICAKDLHGHPWLSCRIFGINAPELSTPEGITARDFLTETLPLGTIVEVVSHGWDKYGGRFDGDIQLPNGKWVSTVMLESGNAVVMKG